MEHLTKHIFERLTTKRSCTVYENELSRFFPVDRKHARKLEAAIQAFAREQGLSAQIRDPGVRVTFKKLDDKVDPEGE